jgi:hypothetical protein
MTRYDPYSYGQVRLDGAPAATDAKSAPDDLLFADGGAVKQGPPADSSWALLDENVDSLLPGASKGSSAAAAGSVEFGADILGETLPADLDADPVGGRARPSAPASTRGGAAPPVPVSGPSRSDGLFERGTSRTVGKPVVSLPPPKPSPAAPRRTPAPLPERRRSSLASLMVPLSLFAAGGMAASWIYVMQQNPVLAGIVAACSLVGAAFAWLLLRG